MQYNSILCFMMVVCQQTTALIISHMDKAAIICHVLSREIQEALVCLKYRFLVNNI